MENEQSLRVAAGGSLDSTQGHGCRLDGCGRADWVLLIGGVVGSARIEPNQENLQNMTIAMIPVDLA
jgi:hypothetical protein